MSSARWAAALLCLLAISAGLRAQGFLPTPLGPPAGVVQGGSASVSRSNGTRRVTVYYSRLYTYSSPYAASLLWPTNSLTIIGSPTPPPTVVVIPVGIPDFTAPAFDGVAPEPPARRRIPAEPRPKAPPPDPFAPADKPPDRPPPDKPALDKPPPDQVPPERPLPGEPASVFRPVDEDNRARAQRSPPPANPGEEIAEARGSDPFGPGMTRPLPDARAEHRRLVTAGKAFFRSRHYGRAAECFARAVAVAPDEAMGHFLLAQAYFALGKYQEGVAAIETGLRLWPDWPTERFRARDLYGPDGDEFSEQFRRLQDTLAGRPDDPALLFLTGYELWFDGRRDDALPLLRRAAGLLPNLAAVERFLQQPH
jgi:hypothetical protein